MIRTAGCRFLVLSSIFICLTSASMAQKGKGAGGNAARKPSPPQVDYPLVHIPKWQINYRLQASDTFKVEVGDGKMFHKPSWNISGSAIVDLRMEDGSIPVIEAYRDSNSWSGRTDSNGTFMGEFWGVPSLGYRQIYAGGGSVATADEDNNRITFQLFAKENQYEISFSIELEGNVATDASELMKKFNELKSQAKSDDVIGEAMVDFLRGIAKDVETKGTKRFKQTISGNSFLMPLPASGAGDSIKISGSKKVQNEVHEIIIGMTDATFSWDIQPYDESKNVNVTLEGCSELGVGQQGKVTAKGQPAGGSYRYWVEPSTAMSVAAQGATANVSGAEPGKGTLFVEYTAPGGKSRRTSQSAVSLLVESINGGQSIPKIGLYDIEGKPTDAIITVPVSLKPSGEGDRIVYKPADPAIISALSQGDSVLLQGVREGKTTLQGTTKCGGPTGPIVSVEVVPCDDEVMAKLAEEERIALESLRDVLKEDGRIRNSKEFTELDIGKSTADLLVKTGGLIIGTLSSPKGTNEAVKTAADLYGAGSNIRDVLQDSSSESVMKAVVQTMLPGLKNPIPAMLSDAYETIEAATKFGEDLGRLEGTAEQLENTRKWAENWNRVVEDIQRRKKICKPKAGEPQKKSEQKPPKKDPKPTRDPQPTPKNPPTDTPSGSESGGEPASDPGDSPVEPPSPQPPTSTRGPVGLPYSDEKGECGCSKSTGIGLASTGAPNAQDIAQIGQGLYKLGQCSGQFSNDSLSGYTQTLKEWTAVLSDIETATKGDPNALKNTAAKLVPRLDAVLGKTKTFDTEGQKFYRGFEMCPAAAKNSVATLSASPEANKTAPAK
jgi:hypothetical protein